MLYNAKGLARPLPAALSTQPKLSEKHGYKEDVPLLHYRSLFSVQSKCPTRGRALSVTDQQQRSQLGGLKLQRSAAHPCACVCAHAGHGPGAAVPWRRWPWASCRAWAPPRASSWLLPCARLPAAAGVSPALCTGNVSRRLWRLTWISKQPHSPSAAVSGCKVLCMIQVTADPDTAKFSGGVSGSRLPLEVPWRHGAAWQ